MDDKWKITVAPDSPLTKAQIEAMVAKLSANGLAPGARVFDLSEAPYDDQPEEEAGKE